MIYLFQAADEAVRRYRSDVDTSVTAAMTTVFWMAKEDIPIKKYQSLMQMQKLQGCESLSKLQVSQNATYLSRSSGEEFQACIADQIHSQIISNIKSADMYSILVDESTDISISKQMVVYVRVVDSLFVPHTYFLKNITVDNPKSDAAVLFNCINQCLTEEGLELNKLRGFGSDGASVMVGRHHGVATRVKEKTPHCISIHCMAHRFNLATCQASNNIPYMKYFEKTLSDLYYYFGGSKSGNRKCELAEIQKILDDPVVKIKECHEIRWIAFYEAVNAVYRSWPSLATYFKRHDDKTSKSFKTKLTEYKFLAVLHILMDILPSVATLSMVLQKKDIDIAAVNPALDGLKDKIKLAKKGKTHYQSEFVQKIEKKKDKEGKTSKIVFKGHVLDFGKNLKDTSKEIDEIRVAFCENLLKNIDDRFPKEAVSVASAFHVLGMRPLSFLSDEEKQNYGHKELQILIDHYANEARKGDIVSPPLINGLQCEEEWSLAKRIVMEQMYPRDSIKLLWKLMFEYHKDILQNLLVLAKLALIMPYQTADCERGFSCQNGIKTARRNRLKETNLNVLMTIKCEGGLLEDYDFTPSIKTWKAKKERRICSKSNS